MLGNGRAAGLLIQRGQGHTPRVMAAGQAFNRLHTQQIQQPAGLDLVRVVAQQQGAHRGAFALHHRVGGERGRQRHQFHLRQPVRRQAVQ